MRRSLSNLLAVLLFGVLVQAQSLCAQNQSDEAAVRAIPQAFAAAWGKHDGHQLAQLMSTEVDFVNIGGDWLHGRADFELYTSRLLSGRFKESVLTVRESAVNFVKPDLAILHWSWGIAGDRNEDLTPRQPRYGLFTMVVQKQGSRWLVLAAQNTNWIPGPNPEMDGIKPAVHFPNVVEKP